MSSLSAGTLALPGCSFSQSSGEEAPINNTDTHSGDSADTTPTPTQSADTPFEPRSLLLSADSKILIDEHYGTISFDQNHPYFLVPVAPENRTRSDDQCLILEYDVTGDIVSYRDSQLDVRLIYENEREEYITEAKDERTCYSIAGHTLHCRDDDELEQFESSFDSDAFAVTVEDRQYKRVLLPPEQYWLVFDATDIWAGKDLEPPEIQETQLDIAVRVMRDPLDRGEREAITTISNIAADIEGNQCERLAEINTFASEICSLDGADQLSRESIETFERDMTAVHHYSALLHDLLNLLNTRYDLDLPVHISSRLETYVEWGSSLLPLVGAFINVCSDACDLATTTCGATTDAAERRIKDFLVSLFSLVAEVVLLAWGVSGKVAQGVIKLADKYVLWYLKELVGFPVYAVILKQASMLVDNSVGAALGYILDWTRQVWKMDNGEDEGIDSLDLETLANINEDNIHDWTQWDELLSDRKCGAVVASGSGIGSS